MNYQNLVEVARITPNITVSISLGELIKANTFLVNETRKSLEQIIADESEEKYLSVQKACELLEINPTTAWRWAKQGYLKPVEIGGRRRYRMSDIKKILEK